MPEDPKELWNRFAISKRAPFRIDPILGRYKSDEFLNLVKNWSISLEGKRIFKTDLCEEAFGEDEILFSLTNNNSLIYGSDISGKIVKKANAKKIEKGLNHNYLTADVRNLPFKDSIFDFILSTSTLDHFTTEDDFKKSLIELKRIVKPAGYMVIAFNNKCNLNFYLMLKLEKILGLKHYPVQFYHLRSLKRIFKNVGLYIQAEDTVVHIISPINSILRLLRILMNKDTIDKFAQICVSFFKWLGNRKRSRFLTGWFITLKCVKYTPLRWRTYN